MKKRILIMIMIIAAAAALAFFSGCSIHKASSDSREDGKDTAQSWDEESPPTEAQRAEDYFNENATVVSVIDAEDSEETLSEKEAIRLFEKRGFSGYPVIYDASIDGEYIGDTEASSDSDEMHPLYFTYYVSEKELVWTIYLINGEIMANPVSYNLTTEAEVQLLISETDVLVSYDNDLNQFYVTVPNESAVVLKSIDTIDAASLDMLTIKEIEAL